MADCNSFDCSEPDLLCDEENNGFCSNGGDEYDDLFNPFNEQNHRNSEKIGPNGGSESRPLIPFPSLSAEHIGWMVEREREFLLGDAYLERLRSGELVLGLRKEALDWMYKACAYHKFGESCLYLAVNYLDRFLSVYNMPVCSSENGGKHKWTTQLVAVACLLLAAKVEEVDAPSTLGIQAGETEVVFQGKTVQRMEIVVLEYLKWRMKPYTPCDYIDYYLRKINDTEFPPEPLISRSVEIILSTIKGIDFLGYRPSEIAAAVAVNVSGGIHGIDIDKALPRFIGIDKEKLVMCLQLIQDLTSNSGVSSSVPHSPIGVLDAACWSYKSDGTAVGSCPSSSNTSPDNKRRKLDRTTSNSLIS
ncbi:cyclin-D4-1-like [Primulina eburnea]|uniref:cyclin-D4-1-like n=1 Tax=Primulina eburnea TaxID=1245227 RepID=UPI003C6C8E56